MEKPKYRDDGYYLITYAYTELDENPPEDPENGTDFRIPKGSIHSARGTNLREMMVSALALVEMHSKSNVGPENIKVYRYKDLSEDNYLNHGDISWTEL